MVPHNKVSPDLVVSNGIDNSIVSVDQESGSSLMGSCDSGPVTKQSLVSVQRDLLPAKTVDAFPVLWQLPVNPIWYPG